METQTAGVEVTLELDEIQSGALHERPAPYVGTYLLLRIDDRKAGRELVRRLPDVVDFGAISSEPTGDAWVTAAFTYQGLKALGVPQESLDSFAPEFKEGMAARAAALGDVGESGVENWEEPLGTPDVHVALAAHLAGRGAAGRDSRARDANAGRPRRRGADLAPGLLPAPHRADLVRIQGRDRPAGGRGKRHSRLEPG